MDDARRCRAQRKHGRGPCKKAAILGGRVCRAHGGAAPQVKRKAAERLAEMVNKDRTLEEAAALAFADVTDLYDEDFRLKPMIAWPPALRRAIRRIEPRLANMDPGDGHSDRVLRVELHDKIKPLEMLFKHLGMLTERMDVNIKGDLAELIYAGRKRARER